MTPPASAASPPIASGALPATSVAEQPLDPARLPRHIAIIMDGNGRWAQRRDLPRALGHRAGAKAVLTIVEACKELGIEALTLYSFSSENWKRPADEVAALMELCREFIRAQCETMLANNIRFRRIGRREGMPAEVLAALDEAERATSHCTALTLCLALNYGSRTELVDAAKAIAERVGRGELSVDAIDEATIERHLYTAGLPDPDLLIRTAGERRISNYLLWQISYAELHVAECLWPDFGPQQLREAIRDFASRERRFGDVRVKG